MDMEQKPLMLNIMALGHTMPWEKSINIAGNSVMELMGSELSEKLKKIKRIYFTGCGTSLYAGQVGKYFVEHIAGISAEAVPAYTFNKYFDKAMLNDEVLVIGISATGTSSTVSKTIMKSRESGGIGIAITANKDSEIARSADAVILSGSFDDTTTVKSKSYVYSMITMYTFAVYLAKLNKKIDEKEVLRWMELLEKTGKDAPSFVKNNMVDFVRLSEKYYNSNKIFIIGAGPNLGTIEEAALKIVEMSRIYAECQEVEDFLHGRFRVVDKTSPFFIIAPKGRADEKFLDFLSVLHKIGVDSIVLTNNASKEIRSLATEIILMPDIEEEFTTPFLSILPFYIIGYKMGVLRGHDPGARRYDKMVPQETYYKDYKSEIN